MEALSSPKSSVKGGIEKKGNLVEILHKKLFPLSSQKVVPDRFITERTCTARGRYDTPN